tara:strand:+ start:304 stop:417 length:114 start_codon:yes stop_codon:yes gene_type:complete
VVVLIIQVEVDQHQALLEEQVVVDKVVQLDQILSHLQ